MSENILLKEQTYLDEVITSLETEIENQTTNMKEIPKKHRDATAGDAFLVENLMSLAESRINALKKAKKNPYFGKFNFKNENGKEYNICVGKAHLKDKKEKTLVTDWRAPICSLFYSSESGYVKYKAPEGIIKGFLDSKKQIIIEESKVKKVLDTSFVSNDKILQEYLNTHASNKMKDIIASIQKEQNDIIRYDMDKSVIIQGIAGSGKTSVALHRIAYLIYFANQEKLNDLEYNPNQFLIIGPNNCFLDYISSVLPDLDVTKVNQSTFVTIMQKQLNDKINIIDNNDVLEKTINDENIKKISKYKNSNEYLKLVDKFIDNYLDNFFKEDLVIDNTILVDKSYFKNNIILHKSSIQNKIDLFKTKLVNDIKNNYVTYSGIINDKLYKKFDNLVDKKEKDIIHKKIIDNTKKAKNGFKNEINKYFNNLLISPVNIYKKFVESINDENLRKLTLNSLKKKTISRDDLIAIMRIKEKVYGLDISEETIHVVIDEAQDFSYNEFKLIKKIYYKATYSIFGDLNQSVFAYRSIDNWDEILNIFDDINLIKLNKSYRTTDQIIKEANKLSKLLSNEVSHDNVREGQNVSYYNIEKNNVDEFILEKVKESKKDGYTSLAIIVKTEKEAINLHKRLNQKSINIVSSNDNKYIGGTCIIPIALAKGLEFDHVIIADCNNDTYDINDRSDLTLLYVAMTRALHKMDIIYNNDLVYLLK